MHTLIGSHASSIRILYRYLKLFLLLVLAQTAAHAEIPPVCLDLYIESGAVPVGPDASYGELLECRLTAATADTNLGNYYCTASSGSVYIEEYCGAICPADIGDIHLCFNDQDDEEEDKEKEQGDDCDSEGNPCNPSSGNKYQQETDYHAWDGRLALVRSYNSLAPKDGPFGYGWSATGFVSLAFDGTDAIRVNQATGRSESWHQVSGAWQGDADSRLQLQAEADGYLLVNPDLSREHYDALGRLASRTQVGGLTTRYDYNDSGQLSQITGPFGRTMQIGYNGDGRIQTIVTPDGELGYAYDSRGNLVEASYPDGSRRRYHYEDTAHPHHLTGITDERDTRYATWSYQADGRVTGSEHAGGVERVGFSYADGTTRVDGALGDSRTYSYTQMHGVNKITGIDGDPCTGCANGALHSRRYDDDGFLIGYTDWNGNETKLTRNARHLIESRTEALGTPQERSVTTEWHPVFDLPVRIVEPARTTELSYDDTGRLLNRTQIDNTTGQRRTITYRYHPQGDNGAGLIAAIDGPRDDIEDITRYDYDIEGNLSVVTNALGQTTRITAHDPSGRPLTLIDPNGLTTRLAYDVRGRLVSQAFSDAATTRTTSYAYDPAGELTEVTAPDGSRLQFEYDSARRLIGLQDSEGNRIDVSLDAMGHPLETRISDPAGVLTRRRQQVYNQLGRLTRTLDTHSQASTYVYDDNGNTIRTTDARQNSTRQAYDALDRLRQSTDALEGATRYDYDTQDNLTAVTDPNDLTTRYAYDGLGNRISRNSPDTGTISYRYDEAGNRISQTDARGVTLTYAYDALDRLTAIHYPDSGLDVSYRYDEGVNGIGRLTSMTDADGATAYRYNAYGELIEKRRSANGGSETIISYGYDDAGRLSGMTYPSGNSISYIYDSQGRLDKITLNEPDGTSRILAQNIRYLPFGPIRAYDYGNGLSLTRSFDQDYRLTGQTLPGILESAYRFDPVGNITDWQDLLDTGRDQHFDYDALNRLSSAVGAYGDLGYGYDGVGNRLSLTHGSAAETYNYAADSHHLLEILGDTTDTRRYDAVGNTLESLAGRYSYDDSSRLVSFSKGGVQATYAYNGRGERIRKTVTSGSSADEYLAQAEAAQRQAETYRAKADDLTAQAQSARSEATSLNGKADSAVTQSAQKTQQAQALTQAADKARQAADALNREAVDLQAKAAAYRTRIKVGPGNLQERLKNAYYEGLAEAAEELAAKADEEANRLQAKAGELDQQAESKQAEANTLVQQAETLRRQAVTQMARAVELETQAQTQSQRADAAQAQADEYRRLAENAGDASEFTTRFAYDEQGQIIGEYAEDGSPIREYVYLADQPLALLTKDVEEKEAVYYLHTDHLGGVVKVTDAAQNLIWDVDRRPFGQRTVKTQQIELPLGFPGQYYDIESEGYYNNFRYYDPRSGRYLTSDPIGLSAGINTYAYVSNRPLGFIDRLGLEEGPALLPTVPGAVDAVVSPGLNFVENPVLSNASAINAAATLYNTAKLTQYTQQTGNAQPLMKHTYGLLFPFFGDNNKISDAFNAFADFMSGASGTSNESDNLPGDPQSNGNQDLGSQGGSGSDSEKLERWEDVHGCPSTY